MRSDRSKFIVGEKVSFSISNKDYKKIFEEGKIISILINKKGINYIVKGFNHPIYFEFKEADLWKIDKKYSKETKNELNHILWEKERKELTKNEVLWIFAIKDNRIQEFYNLNYGRYENRLSESTIVSIFSQIMDKVGGWNEAIRYLRIDHTIYTTLRKKTDMPLYEWLFIAIKNFCIHRDIYWMTEWAPEEWQVWVDIAREEWEIERLKVKKEN